MQQTQFQSTRPLRGATSMSHFAPSTVSYFNPRAPCGARLRHQRKYLETGSISIHAPLAGRDDGVQVSTLLPTGISIHAPLAGRDAWQLRIAPLCNGISIHAPLAGRDGDCAHFRVHPTHISIHAPLAGRDSTQAVFAFDRHNFNPRAPCGARPCTTACEHARPQGFQSTRPLRGATAA